MELCVSKNGDGDFCTITEAVNAIPYREPGIIHIKNGIYHEKLFIEKQNITLVGENAFETVLTYGDGAYHKHEDGKNYGTFRSYTAFFGGEHVCVKSLTIENTAGDGRTAGQALAAYVDAECAYFENVRLLGRQDTLFTAPLPDAPHIPGSFIGPREKAPRRKTRQYYESCFIRGDIDFIFGGADAVFHKCEIFSNNRQEAVNGYVAAPCTHPEDTGYLFLNCRLSSDCCPPGTVFLARPWREYGKAAFINCELGAHICPAGWDNWGDPQNEKTSFFTEYESSGSGAHKPRAFGVQLSEEQAHIMLEQAENIYQDVLPAYN